MSALEKQFLNQCIAIGLPEPEQQIQFIPGRRYKADFLFNDAMLVVEVDGGAYIRGRHNRAAGRSADCERDILAILNGYTVIRLTTNMVKNGDGIKYTKKIYEYLLEIE